MQLCSSNPILQRVYMQLGSSNLHFPDVTKTPLAIESSLALTGDEKGPREGRTQRAMERMDGEAESV